MGICTDIMHEFVQQEIRRLYSTYDGWSISMKRMGNSYDTVVTLQRMNRPTREITKILVSFKREVALDQIGELIRPEQILDGTTPRRDYAVMVPAGADVSALPKDLKIMTMRSFAFDGKELVWVKKPVRRNPDAAGSK
jgi:hypothetical protein